MFLYRCASCGSDRVQLRNVNEGFSYGKAVAGALVFGTAGAVAGLAGKKTTKYYCPNCGQTMDYPMSPSMAYHIDEALVNRLKPGYDGILGTIKKQYPGIDWVDPSMKGNNANSVVYSRTEINPNASTEALIERISGFIEDGDWDNANHYCNYLLDKEPTNADLYKNKILIEHQSRDIYELAMQLDTIQESLSGASFNKFMKYGGEDAAKWEEEVLTVKREFQNRRIEAIKEDNYNKQVSIYNKSSSLEELSNAEREFRVLCDYKESAFFADKCHEKINSIILNNAFSSMEKAESLDSLIKSKEEIFSVGSNEDKARAEKLYEKKAAELEEKAKNQAASMRKKIIITIASLIAVIIVIVVYNVIFVPKNIYKKIDEAISLHKYEAANHLVYENKDRIDASQEYVKIGVSAWDYAFRGEGIDFDALDEAETAFVRCDDPKYDAYKDASMDLTRIEGGFTANYDLKRLSENSEIPEVKNVVDQANSIIKEFAGRQYKSEKNLIRMENDGSLSYALDDGDWIDDWAALAFGFTSEGKMKFIGLASYVESANFEEKIELVADYYDYDDKFLWDWTGNNMFTGEPNEDEWYYRKK